MVEYMEEQAGAGGDGAELGLETDQAARRDHVLQARTTATIEFDIRELPAAVAEALHDAALELLVEIDDQLLVGFLQLAIDFLDDDLGARDGKFVAFAAHGFDEHREVQLATTGNLELVRILGFLDLHGDVVQGFTEQALTDLAAGQELAAAVFLDSGERRIVDLEGHADGRFIDVQDRQLLGRIRRADRVGDAQALDTVDGDDVAGLGLGDFAPLKAHEAEHLQHLGIAFLAVLVDHGHRHVGAHLAALDAANADQADIVAVVELADAHLEGAVRIDLRRRYVLHDRFIERRHVAGAHIGIETGIAVQGRGIDHRKIKLLVGGAEAVEQIEGGIEHPVRARAGTIDLVDHDDRLEAHLEGFLGDEARLRHRPVHGIDQDQHRIDH